MQSPTSTLRFNLLPTDILRPLMEPSDAEAIRHVSDGHLLTPDIRDEKLVGATIVTDPAQADLAMDRLATAASVEPTVSRTLQRTLSSLSPHTREAIEFGEFLLNVEGGQLMEQNHPARRLAPSLRHSTLSAYERLSKVLDSDASSETSTPCRSRQMSLLTSG